MRALLRGAKGVDHVAKAAERFVDVLRFLEVQDFSDDPTPQVLTQLQRSFRQELLNGVVDFGLRRGRNGDMVSRSQQNRLCQSVANAGRPPDDNNLLSLQSRHAGSAGSSSSPDGMFLAVCWEGV